jgi:hypothetical protein
MMMDTMMEIFLEMIGLVVIGLWKFVWWVLVFLGDLGSGEKFLALMVVETVLYGK